MTSGTGDHDRTHGRASGGDGAPHGPEPMPADHRHGDTPHAGPVADVFVSYASTDAAVANAVVSALERHGLQCWIAPRDVVPGSLYADGIVRAINGAKVFVLVLSEHAIASGHVGKEVERASSKGRPIIALRTDQGALTPAFEYFLSESQWIDLGPGGVDAAAARLVDAARRYLDGPASTDTRSASGPTGPPPAQYAAAGRGAVAGPVQSGPNRVVVGALAIVALALAGMLVDKFLWSRRIPPAVPMAAVVPPAPVPAAISAKSVAVLPFIDLSEKKDQGYFSDGLAEELIDLLAKIPDLKVTARTSSFSFRGRAVTVGEIGQALKVAHVLEGSVRKAGHTVRITAQLVRVDDGFHLWSETYDRDLKDVFKVQDDIARVVADKLKLTLLAAVPAAQTRTANAEVHNLYLQARYFGAADTAPGLAKSVETFQRAIDLDPGYAPAWAGLSWSTFRQLANGQIPARQGLEKARAAAQKAIALDPRLPDGYEALALVQVSAEHDWAGGRASLNEALRADPSNVRALFGMAHLTRVTGSVQDAIPLFRQVLERDPLHLLNRRYFARVLYYAGQLDEAEATVRQVLAMNPSFPAAHYELGRILLARGQAAAAMTEFEAEKTEGWREFGLPLGYHALGRTAEADAALRDLVAHSAGSEYQVGETYAFFGDATQAFDWLNRAVDADPGIQWLRGDPLLKGITADPRYAALLKRLNLPP